jgi:hypothetical protein
VSPCQARAKSSLMTLPPQTWSSAHVSASTAAQRIHQAQTQVTSSLTVPNHTRACSMKSLVARDFPKTDANMMIMGAAGCTCKPALDPRALPSVSASWLTVQTRHDISYARPPPAPPAYLQFSKKPPRSCELRARCPHRMCDALARRRSLNVGVPCLCPSHLALWVGVSPWETACLCRGSS